MSDLDEHLNGLPLKERAEIRWQIKSAAAARLDLEKFFEFVIREEVTQLPVKALPHQRVFMGFAKKHRRAVVRMPVGFGKTYATATDVLFALGREPTMRAAIISASEAQAAKPLSMVRSYIEESPQLRLVFPNLVRTQRDGEPWTQSAITVKRPYGIRDPSVGAFGMDSKRLTGSRLKYVYVDDLLSKENSHTKEQREAVKSYFKGEVLSRIDVDSRVIVTNTPRDGDDLTYWLDEVMKWPTCTMDAYGDITFSNSDFDCEDIRPAYEIAESTEDDPCRLAAHDAIEYLGPAYESAKAPLPEEPRDTGNLVSLWPERWSLEVLEDKRIHEHEDGPIEWDQTMRCRAYSDATSRVKRAWIEHCQQLARDLKCERTVSDWNGGNTFTGVDLAVGLERRHDRTCFFTIFVDSLGRRRILDIEANRWTGKQILEKFKEKHERFGSIFRVETNAAQKWMQEFAIEFDSGMPVRSHNTGRNNKMDVNFGVEKVFADIENALYLIPSGDKEVNRWISDMYRYDPAKHTPDTMMAAWFAREQARQSGAFAIARMNRQGVRSVLGNVMAR